MRLEQMVVEPLTSFVRPSSCGTRTPGISELQL